MERVCGCMCVPVCMCSSMCACIFVQTCEYHSPLVYYITVARFIPEKLSGWSWWGQRKIFLALLVSDRVLGNRMAGWAHSCMEEPQHIYQAIQEECTQLAKREESAHNLFFGKVTEELPRRSDSALWQAKKTACTPELLPEAKTEATTPELPPKARNKTTAPKLPSEGKP